VCEAENGSVYERIVCRDPVLPAAFVLLHLSHSTSIYTITVLMKLNLIYSCSANYSSSDKASHWFGCCSGWLFCCISLASHTPPPPRLFSLWNQSTLPVFSSLHQLTYSKGEIKNVISTVYIPLNCLSGSNTRTCTLRRKGSI